MSIKVALIGGGIWAREEHLPAVQASENLVLVAVFSRTLKSAKAIADAVPDKVDVYSADSEQGYEELLKRSDVDAFIISLPIKNQATYIRSALLAGKHVLSEKPVCENVQDAKYMINWYRSEIRGPSWCVAENWRFLNTYAFAREQIRSMGPILGFQGRQHALVQQSGKFYQTEWRKTPTHQGGYLLDGGVHYMAGLRQLLEAQPGNEIVRLSAFTNQLRDYLPPADTINAVLKTRSGVTGTFQLSVGTSLCEDSWTVSCLNGWITVEDSKVILCRDGQVTRKEILNERTGVPPEIRAWGEALAVGKVLKEQKPEAALADLELIELMLRSGETDGTPMDCTHQHV
ncbi:hypothetical protein AK830_g2748 [Neonectria ditissima]|uniref:Gfo/Idh/MocA-like oxidoreductase N-terminal domain-containing protein n=1 Tax=Neonectria ditissima TaxID=78410 RepID=A0A0P7BE43_9HYPO|nr:hypothetical protein AK830_g2748 [Neonectria ditissima]